MKYLILTLTLICSIAFGANEYRQKNASIFYSTMGIGKTTAAATSSLVDMSSTTKGLLPPRLTTTQRDAVSSPATGLEIFNSTTGFPEFYSGSAWRKNGLYSLGAQTSDTQSFANDTNVVITSSNNTHSLGWSSTLSLARGGSGASLTAANGGVIYSDAAKMVVLGAGTSGQVLTSGGAGAPAWSSAVSMANSGTGAAISPINGGIVYSTASTMALLAAGTSGQILRSGGAASPAWSTGSADGIITAWAAYTPASTQGLGTIATVNMFWRQEGESVRIKGFLTTGTVSGSEVRVSLPNSYTSASTTLLPASSLMLSGKWVRETTANFNGFCAVAAGHTYFGLSFADASNNPGVLSTGSNALGSSEVQHIDCLIPISGLTND